MSALAIPKDQLEPWAKYLVVILASNAVAQCSTIEKVVECMLAEDVVFGCEVVRIEDSKTVWPFINFNRQGRA